MYSKLDNDAAAIVALLIQRELFDLFAPAVKDLRGE